MPDDYKIDAKCLCGAVHIHAAHVNEHAGACHCDMCRKWGGGPLLAVDCGTDVSFDGKEYISLFNSSEWAERGFCSKCGTHLFYRLKGTGQYSIPAGLFDDVEFNFNLQIFTDKKPAYYSFANETEMMTGAEVFEKYAPPPDVK